MSLLNCSVCQKQLVLDPITLSCGYTVCLTCLPSQAAFEGLTFICPVKRCSKESHLFGPSLCLDDTVHNIIKKDLIQQEQMTDETYNTAATILQCSIGKHLLEQPITNHCGHTFCKLCLLQYKLSNNSCQKCQKRLPSYQFIQCQPLNFILDTIATAFKQLPRHNFDITATNRIVNASMSFMNLDKTVYENVPIYLSGFPVLPSQKLRIPIYTKEHRAIFLNSLLPCKEYQCLCFGILSKSKANYKGHFGTIVKITAMEQRGTDLVVDVTGLDRFQAVNVIQESEDFILVDLEMKFETLEDLGPIMTKAKHWTDYHDTQQQRKITKQQPFAPKLPDSPDMGDIAVPSATPPTSPPAEAIDDLSRMSPSIKLSNRVHDFISDLAHSTPSNSFCSAIEGLLGPVWLESVQGLHGALPSADNAVAMCWWAAIVLPVSNNDRYHLLGKESLEERLNIILSWISDLKSQWGNCRRKAMNSAVKVQAFR